MAQNYTRQSSFADGDTVTAALFNNEYNQLVNAFAYSSSSASSTGHRHDGTAGQGGNVPQIGDLDFLNKVVVDGTNNRVGFFVEVSSSAVEQVRVQDGAIVPVTDNDIDLGTSSLEFKDGYFDGTVHADAINFNGTAITATAAELNIMDGVTSTTAELNILDGVTASATDINLIDGITNGTVIASKAIITDSNKDITGGRNITISGELDAATLDISGDIDVDGTTNLDVVDIDGAVDMASTLAVTGVVTANAGVVVDNITIDGNEIDVGSGDLTIDSAGDIIFDAALNDVIFSKNGTERGRILLDEADFKIQSTASNSDIIFNGNDGGSAITALTLDMSAAGAATFNSSVTATSLDISGDVDVDGTLEADAITVNGTALASVIAGTTVTLASTVTVTDSTANTNFPVVFHDESNALLDDTGALRYNPSTGELLVPKLTVAGTTTTVDTVTMNAANAIIFEGATADAHETTLTIIDPTGDRTINLPNVSGTIPVLAAVSTTQITSTPEELNILDGVTSTAAELNILDGVTSTAAELNILDGVTSTAAELNVLDGITAVVGELNALDLGATAVGTAIASKAVILDANKDYTGIRNLTITGELDGATLDISGNADIDGTLESDAITIGGVSTDTLYASPGFAVAMAIAL